MVNGLFRGSDARVKSFVLYLTGAGKPLKEHRKNTEPASKRKIQNGFLLF